MFAGRAVHWSLIHPTVSGLGFVSLHIYFIDYCRNINHHRFVANNGVNLSNHESSFIVTRNKILASREITFFNYNFISKKYMKHRSEHKIISTGGLTAVMYTDTFQAFLMLGGGIVLMGMGG